MNRFYILSDEDFAQLERLLPRDPLGRGRPPKVSDRDALEGILYALRTGTPWRDLPKDYGPWHTIYMRWVRWIQRGAWEDMLKILQRLKPLELEIVFLDSTIVRAHQHAAGAQKKEASKRWGARVAG